MIDSHCHLDHEPLFKDISNVLKRSKETGIKKLLTICTTLESFKNILNINSLLQVADSQHLDQKNTNPTAMLSNIQSKQSAGQ